MMRRLFSRFTAIVAVTFLPSVVFAESTFLQNVKTQSQKNHQIQQQKVKQQQNFLKQQQIRNRYANFLKKFHFTKNKNKNSKQTQPDPRDTYYDPETTKASDRPGPYPFLTWMADVPGVPMPPLPDASNCNDCMCILAIFDSIVYPDGDLLGRDKLINENYICKKNDGTMSNTPKISWDGVVQMSEKKMVCPQTQSIALIIEDLDYPNGNGESNNRVLPIYWAVNIPGTWTSFGPENVETKKPGTDVNLVHVGMNEDGVRGLAPICPKKGLHRYRLTLYALKDYVSSNDSPIPPDAPLSAWLGKIESLKLAKYVRFAKMSGNPTNKVS